MSDNIIRYYLPRKNIDTLEWSSFVRIVNDILENIKLNKDGAAFLDPNDLKRYMKLYRNIKHEGLRNYIFDTLQYVYNYSAKRDLMNLVTADVFTRAKERMNDHAENRTR